MREVFERRCASFNAHLNSLGSQVTDALSHHPLMLGVGLMSAVSRPNLLVLIHTPHLVMPNDNQTQRVVSPSPYIQRVLPFLAQYRATPQSHLKLCVYACLPTDMDQHPTPDTSAGHDTLSFTGYGHGTRAGWQRREGCIALDRCDVLEVALAGEGYPLAVCGQGSDGASSDVDMDMDTDQEQHGHRPMGVMGTKREKETLPIPTAGYAWYVSSARLKGFPGQ
ncbi:hypothetical protein KIPB_004490 [Kipferlia bialata]|uniref:Uncharacterized protein n=1 Tax=Kipferlia bialata TaxID=797122 RepID=A0A9K3CV62_9EUKA|nr:hypothetical protein KIPB_004490 [Kipferlia bialata]|eukprot:g4490.t1